MNNAAINVCVQVFLWTYVFISLGYISRGRFSVLYSYSMFNLWKNYQTVFLKVCTILHSHQQCMRVPIIPHLHQYLLLSVFLIIAILVDVKWYLIMVLICIFLIGSDVEHLFMFFLAICISLLEKCVFKSFAHF
uniref:Uncharacterized protein n=1 Tax=Equus caballus TaxID=9796 RepID=A0A9L0QZ93_HORSE